MALQQYQIVMRTGPTTGKTYPLEASEITVGRDPSNDIVINDAEVSRKHARLLFQDGSYVLEDLGSTNGTYVNGQRLLGPHRLRPGDLVLLGENISMGYEQPVLDEDGTVAVRPRQVETPPAPIPSQYTYEQQERPRPQEPLRPSEPPASYSGYVPPGPGAYAVPEVPPPASRFSGRRSWVYAGCGCLIVVLCVLLVGGYAFDSMNLYCVPPFDALFPCP
jgi:hypothetical protein